MEAPVLTGLAPLAKLAYEGGDLNSLWATLMDRATAEPGGDPGAMMDLSMILQLTGNREQGLAIQAEALGLSRVYRRVHGSGEGLRILALVVPGDFMANMPLDFMLEGSDFTVDYLYLDETLAVDAAPPHDLAFVAIGESDPNTDILIRLAPLLDSWPRPVVNRHSGRIAALSRDQVSEAFRGAVHTMAPAVVRTPRTTLAAAARGGVDLDQILPRAEFPIIVRPIGSHAGRGLSKIDGPSDLDPYLAVQEDADFYASPFVDYRNADGRFRKYRIAFMRGRPYLSHLAISDHWMVHYLSAGMAEDAAKRAEEAQAMAAFDEDFAPRHRAAFEELNARIGLDYFAIDCAEMRDGRLLLFEADVAMIVHAMDPPDLFPYKPPQMRKVFVAFQAMFAAALAEAA